MSYLHGRPEGQKQSLTPQHQPSVVKHHSSLWKHQVDEKLDRERNRYICFIYFDEYHNQLFYCLCFEVFYVGGRSSWWLPCHPGLNNFPSTYCNWVRSVFITSPVLFVHLFSSFGVSGCDSFCRQGPHRVSGANTSRREKNVFLCGV